jgi:putative MATE family efflux protein
MLGWCHFPKLGLNGTAVAGLLMQALATITLSIYLRRKKHIVSPDWMHLCANRHTSWLIMKIGFPSAIQQCIMSLGNIFVIGIVNSFGLNAAAALTSAGRVDMIAFMPIMTFGIAVSTLVGQNIGANLHHRVKEVFWWGNIVGGGITFCFSMFALLMPRTLLHMFANDPAVINIGTSYLRIIGSCYVLYAVLFVSNGVINGAGYTFVTTIISLISLWIARVPLAWYLSHRMHRVEGVWYAIIISTMIALVISLGFYVSGFWKKPIISHHPQIESEMYEDAVMESFGRAE